MSVSIYIFKKKTKQSEKKTLTKTYCNYNIENKI